jgi:hypothetical protein
MIITGIAALAWVAGFMGLSAIGLMALAIAAPTMLHLF